MRDASAGWFAAALLALALMAGVSQELHTASPPIPNAPPKGPLAPKPVSVLPPWPWQQGGIFHAALLYKSVPFPVQQVTDATVPQGQYLLEHPGRRGIQLQYGNIVSDIVAPRPATLAKGTATVYALTVGKQTYHYTRVFTVMTTAYNGTHAMNGPWGAVAAWGGAPLHPGDVAVDPRVIPLGSYLYIPGYGVAHAVDTGSAVTGDHIDLFFRESDAAVGAYGIHFEKVYLLTGPPNPPSS